MEWSVGLSVGLGKRARSTQQRNSRYGSGAGTGLKGVKAGYDVEREQQRAKPDWAGQRVTTAPQ